MRKNATYQAKIVAFLYDVVAVPEQSEGCYYFNDWLLLETR